MSVPVISITICYNGLDFHRECHDKSDNYRQGGYDQGTLNNQMNLDFSLQIIAIRANKRASLSAITYEIEIKTLNHNLRCNLQKTAEYLGLSLPT
jgi:hypothetical protein